MTAVHVINRLPSAMLKFEVPYKKLMRKPVDYNDMRAFGCLAIAHNSTHGTDKFAPRGVLRVFIGYPSATKGYRLLKLDNMQTFISRDVVFHEGVFPLNKNVDKICANSLPAATRSSTKYTYDDELEVNTGLGNDHQENEPREGSTINAADDNESENENVGDPVEEETQEVRRSTRASKQPTWMNDFVTSKSNNALSINAVTSEYVSPKFHYFLAAIVPQVDPFYFSQEVKFSYWVEAMNAELDALKEMKHGK